MRLLFSMLVRSKPSFDGTSAVGIAVERGSVASQKAIRQIPRCSSLHSLWWWFRFRNNVRASEARKIIMIAPLLSSVKSCMPDWPEWYVFATVVGGFVYRKKMAGRQPALQLVATAIHWLPRPTGRDALYLYFICNIAHGCACLTLSSFSQGSGLATAHDGAAGSGGRSFGLV